MYVPTFVHVGQQPDVATFQDAVRILLANPFHVLETFAMLQHQR